MSSEYKSKKSSSEGHFTDCLCPQLTELQLFSTTQSPSLSVSQSHGFYVVFVSLRLNPETAKQGHKLSLFYKNLFTLLKCPHFWIKCHHFHKMTSLSNNVVTLWKCPNCSKCPFFVVKGLQKDQTATTAHIRIQQPLGCEYFFTLFF